MEGRTLDQLRAGRQTWDGHAAETVGIDRWCSRSPWVLGVHRAFSDGDVIDDVVVGEAADGEVAFARRALEDGSLALLPLDATWAFGASVVTSAGAAVDRFCRDAAGWLIADPSWRLVACAGVAEGSALDRALIAAFAPHVRVLAGPETLRCVASLDGGLDGWEARRTRTFRRNLRQARRRSEDAAVRIEIADHVPPHAILARLHAVERTSWKGQEGSGIESDEMSALYGSLVHDLSALDGALRCAFARLDGHDVGFILGGVIGDTYRGLQLSFVESVRALSIGNLLQTHEVGRLCDAGVARYDLGMDIPYKRSWGEQLVATRTLLMVR